MKTGGRNALESKNRSGNLLFAGKHARHPNAFARNVDIESPVHEIGIALDDELAAFGEDIRGEEEHELVALFGNEALDCFANLVFAIEHGLQVDSLVLADVDLVAVGEFEFLGIGVDHLVDRQLGRVGAALEDFHAVLNGIDAHILRRLGNDGAIEIGSGGRLHDDGVGQHGAQKQSGDVLRQLHALNLEFARDHGGAGANRHNVDAKRLRGDKAAQAMMVHDFDDFGILNTICRLQRFVMVDQDDLVALADGLDQARSLNTALLESLGRLWRKTAQAAGFIDDVFAVCAGELVLKIGVADRRRNGIVIGVFMTEHQDGRCHGRFLLDSFAFALVITTRQCTMAATRPDRTVREACKNPSRSEGRAMKVLGIRDIIGPIMIGPSSSHTAGALRIALMCRRLLAGEPRKATFTLYGSFAHTYRGHGTDKALVAGLLGMATDDLRIRESFDLAKKAGLEFSFVPAPNEPCEHPNTVDIEVTDETGSITSMRGESIGGGAAVISRINGIDVRLSGEYHSIVVKQRDAKGVLAHIATCLNVFDVNIATTSLFRERKGDIAFTIMETDDEVDESIARAIAKHPDIYDVRIVKSDRATDAVPPQTTQSNAKPKGFGADLTPEAAADLFEQLDFPNAATMLAYCEKEQIAISEATCRRERCMLASNGIAVDDTRNYLIKALETMRESATGPLCDPVRSMGGLIGGEAAALSASEESGPCGALLARATTYAMAVLETNASMGRIVAAPTAGSSGVLPAMLLACQDVHEFSDEQIVDALANAAGIGYLITRNATVSGAEGGCQAEVGAASAMAASAACELFGGTPRQCFAAASNAIAGLLGLVCDPIAGLVEAPCQKRNATGVANALVSAQIALAGIDNLVDFDQTVDAMYKVGRSLPFELRESALGGLAAAPSACAFCQGCAH